MNVYLGLFIVISRMQEWMSFLCMRWDGDGILNGELLNLMIANGFEVLITIDKNLQHQQNLSDAKIALITIKASSNKIKDLKPAMPRVLNALIGIAPGQRIVIEA
jgi:hypothetical protein